MTINKISISAEWELNTHDLNNEGVSGNYTETRMATIINNNKLECVNSISGDMIKHSISTYIQNMAKDSKLNLCCGCETNNANRINNDKNFASKIKNTDNIALDTQIIKYCASDDMNGIMITSLNNQNMHYARKSVYECSAVIGIPYLVNTDSKFHVKYSDIKSENKSENAGQMTFYKPQNSGIYASVITANLDNISMNQYTKENIFKDDPEELKKRKILLLKSIMATYISPLGASKTTQNPHSGILKGFITTSSSIFPAPSYSAIHEDYGKQLNECVKSLNNINDSIKIYEFKSLSEFINIINTLINIL